jgi:predicted aldo/keto reductase-like oxidoreductase
MAVLSDATIPVKGAIMEYRKLGNTGLEVSAIGMGCVQIASSRIEVATAIVRRALELGVNYFDVARAYGDAEIKVGLGIAGAPNAAREDVVISTKTSARAREDAWRQINESLERLHTSYVDNLHLHSLRSTEDIDRRLGPDGALKALIEARDQGMIHHIGCTSHRSEVLIEALRRFDFEVILVPMNLVEREPLDELIPMCEERGVGVTIMKPLATGLLPAPLALKWLLNQPIATAVPGITTLMELEEDAAVGSQPTTLASEERRAIQEARQRLEHVRCRICGLCYPCPREIPISMTLGTDVVFNHYRTMGPEAFRAFRWSPDRIERELERRPQIIAAIESCTRCGVCEERCPYGLPVMDMLQQTLPVMRDMVDIFQNLADA